MSNSEFTWCDALPYLPFVAVFLVPLFVMNSLSGGNGLGWQKGVPQFLIQPSKRR